ncbi:MAG: hypothetical protein A2W05_00180 [Candidatus Schekmanbacteria bacterium RBG_16_38_10]|uniref:Uncharacterized protein n=1 Tax=Candidatus Schekmanbacteria bacterium RBG_16_38_10 TaxID=1817879 RepID=A0A1F7RNM4_9BACT|nr:MAG: hypothetical protein A2W05_00180 [Candidatus Schekmanbacteria bacterium RBG_16_38_10]
MKRKKNAQTIVQILNSVIVPIPAVKNMVCVASAFNTTESAMKFQPVFSPLKLRKHGTELSKSSLKHGNRGPQLHKARWL